MSGDNGVATRCRHDWGQIWASIEIWELRSVSHDGEGLRRDEENNLKVKAGLPKSGWAEPFV